MGHKVDDTLRDDNRRELAFATGRDVEKVLPDHFKTEYPKLVSFLKEYFHFEDSDGSPSRLVNDLFYARDINQVDESLLSYIEDELLLGQAYFEGFLDKRTAAKFSHNLYSTKGTRFSIQQFFRMFYGIDVEVDYPKKDVFTVGSSEIGANSIKFLTNNELYQTFAIRIISELSQKDWERPYKLFVHPAGMFVGSEVRLENTGLLNTSSPLSIVDSDAGSIDVVGFNTALFSQVNQTTPEITGLLDSGGTTLRVIIDDNLVNSLATVSLPDLEKQYRTMRAAELRTSPTFDLDSDGVGTLTTLNPDSDGRLVGKTSVNYVIDFSNEFTTETFDQDKFETF
tara:strand:- start:11 stop:1030 length:1020 start_codon:yes stop_codon:yes gene_type:complete